MARNNLIWIKGDITGDIYYDTFRYETREIQYLRLYLMIDQVYGTNQVKGLRVCVYGAHAEFVYGHVRKGSRLAVIGHVQTRKTHKGDWVVEIVADEVEFLRNVDWDAGERVRKDMVRRGLMRPSHKDLISGSERVVDTAEVKNPFLDDLPVYILEDVIRDE